MRQPSDPAEPALVRAGLGHFRVAVLMITRLIHLGWCDTSGLYALECAFDRRDDRVSRKSPSLLHGFDPGIGPGNCRKARLEDDTEDAVDLLGFRPASRVLIGERSTGVGEELDNEASVHGIEDGRCIAVVRHEAGYRQRVDLALAQPGIEPGFGEGPGQRLEHMMIERTLGNDTVQLPAVGIGRERCRFDRPILLHDNHRNACGPSRIDRPADLVQRRVNRGECDRQSAAGVFVLHIDDDQRAARRGGHDDILQWVAERSSSRARRDGAIGPNAIVR